MLDPFLSAGVYHDLGEAIGLLVSLNGDFAIAAKDVDGLDDAFVNILNQLLDWCFQKHAVVC